MSKDAIRKAEREVIKCVLARLAQWRIDRPNGLPEIGKGGVAGASRDLIIAAIELEKVMKDKP